MDFSVSLGCHQLHVDMITKRNMFGTNNIIVCLSKKCKVIADGLLAKSQVELFCNIRHLPYYHNMDKKRDLFINPLEAEIGL